MTICYERYLKDFGFWGGARDAAYRLTAAEFDLIEQILTEQLDDADRVWTETELNDFLWFETDTWLDWIGEDEEDFFNREPC